MKSRENNLKCKIIYLIYDICCRLKMRIGCRTVLLKLSTKIITVLKKRFMRSYSTNTCTKHICQSFFPDLFFNLFSCWSYSRSIFLQLSQLLFFLIEQDFLHFLSYWLLTGICVFIFERLIVLYQIFAVTVSLFQNQSNSKSFSDFRFKTSLPFAKFRSK